MKTTALYLALGLASYSACALPDYDPFADATASGGTAYNVGDSLIGQTNAQGLTWFQAGPTGTQSHPTISAGSLSISGLAPSTGNSVSYGGASGDSSAVWGLGGPVTTGTLYYSMAFQVTALGGLTTGGAIAFGFNNSTGSQTGQPTVIASCLEIRLSGTGYNLGLNKNTTAAQAVYDSVDTFATGSTLFLVGSYTFNTGTTSDDSTSLWINPDSSTFGAASAPTATITSANGTDITSASIASTLVREASTIEPNMTLDDIRVGTAWSDVTPTIPEPSVLALSALGIAAGFGVRRYLRK